MNQVLFYAPTLSPPIEAALDTLRRRGIPSADHICPEITHVLLEIPAFTPGGKLRSGGNLDALLETFPTPVRIIGGGTPPIPLPNYLDLLSDPFYAAKNAAITAQCAIGILAAHVNRAFFDLDILVTGWGRIAKCLARNLTALGANVTVFARKACDRAMAEALGCSALAPEDVSSAHRFDAILNTVPAFLELPEADVILELASAPGLGRSDAVIARGLPGRYAPASSGALIAQRILSLCLEEFL